MKIKFHFSLASRHPRNKIKLVCPFLSSLSSSLTTATDSHDKTNMSSINLLFKLKRFRSLTTYPLAIMLLFHPVRYIEKSTNIGKTDTIGRLFFKAICSLDVYHGYDIKQKYKRQAALYGNANTIVCTRNLLICGGMIVKGLLEKKKKINSTFIDTNTQTI